MVLLLLRYQLLSEAQKLFVWLLFCALLQTVFDPITLCSSEITEVDGWAGSKVNGSSGSGGSDDPNKNLPLSSIPEDAPENSFLEWLMDVLNRNRIALCNVVGDNGTFIIVLAGGVTIIIVAGIAILSGSSIVVDTYAEVRYNQGLFRTVGRFGDDSSQTMETLKRNATIVGEAAQKTAESSQQFAESSTQVGALAHSLSQTDGFLVGCLVGGAGVGAVVLIVFRPSTLLRLMR